MVRHPERLGKRRNGRGKKSGESGRQGFLVTLSASKVQCSLLSIGTRFIKLYLVVIPAIRLECR
jgi:hypothetical protein